MRVGPVRLRLGAVIALAVATGVVVWLVTKGGGHSTPASSTTTTAISAKPIGPVAMTPSALQGLAAKLHQPIYWAGAKPGYTYEVTETRTGNVYVRYLPTGVKIGDPRSNFLIIATYPYANAFAALEAVAKGQGRMLSNGSFALPSAGYAKSVHVAYPRVDFQIEVYDPTPSVARSVAYSGTVRPVGPATG
jgi:hypothetical protein